MKMELESNDPAMALLNDYISKEVEKRVKAVVDEKMLELETSVTSHATSHRDLKFKVYRMEKDLEKLQNEVTELKEMDEENSKSNLQVDSDHDLDHNGSAEGSDLSDLEEKRWGETFGEKPSGDGKLKRKNVTSDEEEMTQQERKPNAAKKPPGKRGRPAGSKNKVLKADLEAENLKLLNAIKKLKKKKE